MPVEIVFVCYGFWTDHKLQWFTNHMGHSIDVHKIYYRATSDQIKRIQVATICLLQDSNRVHEFANKKLEDIQLHGNSLFNGCILSYHSSYFLLRSLGGFSKIITKIIIIIKQRSRESVFVFLVGWPSACT